jgi:carbon storage regulator
MPPRAVASSDFARSAVSTAWALDGSVASISPSTIRPRASGLESPAMLRITRRAGERVIVGGDVVIEVLEVRGAMVRLGIEAPRSISIYREELWLEIKQENEAAANAPDQLPTLPEGLPTLNPE